MYLLQWSGPFRSVEELSDWEEQKKKEGERCDRKWSFTRTEQV